MPSNEVVAALESLHREIEKLEPAIKHVETALQVTETVREISQKHVDLIELLRDEDVNHKNELITTFTTEIAEITDTNKTLHDNTIEIQQQVQLEQRALTELSEKVLSLHDRIAAINFPERLDRLDANVAGIMAAVQSVMSRLDSLERNIHDRLDILKENQKDSTTAIKLAIDEASKKSQRFNFITWLLIIGVVFLLLYQILH